MSDIAHCLNYIYYAEHCGRYRSSVFMQLVVIVLMIWFKHDTLWIQVLQQYPIWLAYAKVGTCFLQAAMISWPDVMRKQWYQSPGSRQKSHTEWFIWVLAAVLLMMGWMKVNLQLPIRNSTSAGKCVVTDYN